jgi:hypothetical protein
VYWLGFRLIGSFRCHYFSGGFRSISSTWSGIALGSWCLSGSFGHRGWVGRLGSRGGRLLGFFLTHRRLVLVDRHIFVGQCSKELDFMLPDSFRIRALTMEAQSCPLSHVNAGSSHGFENKIPYIADKTASNQLLKDLYCVEP